MAFLELSGVKIHYEFLGSGRDDRAAVTLINGYTRPMNDFRSLAKELAKNGFEVLIFDNRGAGKTEIESPFTSEDMVSDILELWEFLGISQSHVLGISMGGIIAQLLAAKNKERILKLILVSTTSSSKWLDIKDDWGDTRESVAKKLSHYFDASFLEKNKLLVNAMVKQIHNEIINGNFLSRARLQREAFLSYDTAEGLQTIASLPLFVIHGDSDRVIPVDAARDFEGKAQKVEIFEGAGHLLLAERPKQLYQSVVEVLKAG